MNVLRLETAAQKIDSGEYSEKNPKFVREKLQNKRHRVENKYENKQRFIV